MVSINICTEKVNIHARVMLVFLCLHHHFNLKQGFSRNFKGLEKKKKKGPFKGFENLTFKLKGFQLFQEPVRTVLSCLS